MLATAACAVDGVADEEHGDVADDGCENHQQ